MQLKKLKLILPLVAAALAPALANASQDTYNFDITYVDGTTFNGQFTEDNSNGAVSSVSGTLTGGFGSDSSFNIIEYSDIPDFYAVNTNYAGLLTLAADMFGGAGFVYNIANPATSYTTAQANDGGYDAGYAIGVGFPFLVKSETITSANSAVPEPTTIALLAAGLLGCAARRNKAAQA